MINAKQIKNYLEKVFQLCKMCRKRTRRKYAKTFKRGFLLIIKLRVIYFLIFYFLQSKQNFQLPENVYYSKKYFISR